MSDVETRELREEIASMDTVGLLGSSRNPVRVGCAGSYAAADADPYDLMLEVGVASPYEQAWASVRGSILRLFGFAKRHNYVEGVRA